MADQKVARYQAAKEKIEEEAQLNRILISAACKDLQEYCENTRDNLIPNIWSVDPDHPYKDNKKSCILL